MILETWADTASPVSVELLLNAVWTEIVSDVSELDGITITRGRSAEGEATDPARLTLTLRNPDGRYSALTRNTQIRVRLFVGGTWYTRFNGYVSSWPVSWGLKGAPQAVVTLEAAGVLRRLSQGSAPVRSPFTRAVATAASMLGYWPMTDRPGVDSVSPLVGSRPGQIVGTPEWQADDAWVGSEPLPVIGTGKLAFTVAANPAGIGLGLTQVQLRFVLTVPADIPANTPLAELATSGGAPLWVISTGGTVGSLGLTAYNSVGATLGTVFGSYEVQDKRVLVSVELQQDGVDTVAALAVVQEGATVGGVLSFTLSGHTLGVAKSVVLNPDRLDLAGVTMGHVHVQDEITGLFAQGWPLAGWAGERAVQRLNRLCGEVGGVSFALAAASETSSVHLGPQPSGTVVELLHSTADAAGGMLYESRTTGNLVWREPKTIYSAAPAAVIPFQDNLIRPFEVVADDANLVNRVTVSRPDGGEWTAEDAASVAAVGLYDTSADLPLRTDILCRQVANWRLHLGSFDGPRYPRIGVNIAHPVVRADPGLRAELLAVDIGRRVDVTDLPPWLPPGPLSLLVQGITETITADSWQIEFACSPFAPWRGGRYSTSADRYSGAGATVAVAATAGQTTLTVDVPLVRWTSADGPFDIMVSGERMTVTNVADSAPGQQTFTVVRAVNGVSKALPVGSPVELADPVYYGL